VYYTGHDYRDKTGLTIATWNAEVGSPGWRMSRAFGEIKKSFRGKAIVFLADCCASGKLVEYAKSSTKPVAVITSAASDEAVPEGWTFTTSLIDVVKGDPALDTDHNGTIDWAEAASTVQASILKAYGHSGAVYLPPGLEISWPTSH